jgi:uncharacterized membrane protein
MIPYLWLKAMHVASILLFIGGLFSQSFALAAGREEARIVAAISRWDRSITAPAMLMAWLSGAVIAAYGAWFGSIWLWVKLAVVLALTGLHGVQSGRLRRRGGGAADTAMPVARTLGFVACAIAVIAALAVTKPA